MSEFIRLQAISVLGDRYEVVLNIKYVSIIYIERESVSMAGEGTSYRLTPGSLAKLLEKLKPYTVEIE